MGSITCSNCKQIGHGYTSCHAPLRLELQLRKSSHQATRENYQATTSGTTPVPPSDTTRPPTRPPTSSHVPTPTRPHTSSLVPTTRPTSSAPTTGRKKGARAGFIAPRTATPGTSSRPSRTIKLTYKIKEYLNASGIDKMSLADIKKMM